MPTPGNLGINLAGEPDQNPIAPPQYVSARVLTANTAEQITVPPNAALVRLSGNVDFYAAYGANPTAVVPADADDGSSNELIKQQGGAVWRMVQSIAKISVITAAAGGGIVTASFYSL
jgi:hypothetical protein